MNCTQCGHPYSMHTLGTEKRCRMRIAYDWDEREKTFLKTAPCRCTGYRGVRPCDHSCPHDYLKNSPTCIYCGHIRSAWEKSV